MKKILNTLIIITLVAMGGYGYAQTQSDSSANAAPAATDSHKLLRSFAFSLGAGYNPTISVGKYASYLTLEYPIIKTEDYVIITQLSRFDANNYSESDFGRNYEGIPNAPDNAIKKSFYNNRFIMLSTGYHKRINNDVTIGLNGGLGYNRCNEDYRLLIPYTQGNGLDKTVTFEASRKHVFLAYSLGLDLRYALGKYVALQGQIMALKGASDFSIQVPATIGFSFQFK